VCKKTSGTLPNNLAFPPGRYPAAQACNNKNDQGFNDWYLPALCEMGRDSGLSPPGGCGTANANLYTTLKQHNLGGFKNQTYWSSSQYNLNASTQAWSVLFSTGGYNAENKFNYYRIRCIRSFNP